MRSQRGATTLITLVTVIFILGFLLSSYIIIQNRLQSQAEIKREITELYGKDVENIDEIYSSHMANPTAVVPIKTAKQLLSVGTGEKFVIDGTIYEYDSDKDYELKNDIEMDVEEYREDYLNEFSTIVSNSTYTWNGINALKEVDELKGDFNGNGFQVFVKTSNGVIAYNESNEFSN